MSDQNEQSGQFDKYMDDIIRREQEAKDKQKAYVESHEDNPALEYNKLYRERPQNRIRMVPLQPINKWKE
jgi:hypothetical protein